MHLERYAASKEGKIVLMRAAAFAASLVATWLWMQPAQGMAAEPYVEEVQRWRHEHERELASENGWLAIAGLYWLQPGRHTLGTTPSSDIVLPPGSAAPTVGTIEFDGSRVVFHDAIGQRALPMEPDEPGPPTKVSTGRIQFWVIRRGDRYGIRIKDPESPLRKQFRGLCWYPVQAAYQVKAKYVSYPEPRIVRIPSIIGVTTEERAPGYVEFQLKGQTLRLEPLARGDKLFFIFRDATSGRATYHAGRFLEADGPKGDTVILDFNKAYHPPCALNPYTTCPLPPESNHLRVPIKAGERLCP